MTKDVDPHDETRAGPPQSIRPGKMVAGHPLGNYELRDVLGEGGMGVVWRAHDPKLDREVAIKVLKRMDAPVSLRQRLQREARAMARLKHPNVLTVYDSGTEGGRDFIAMELVDGCSLDVWLDRHPMPEDVLAAVLAAGRGLAAAHRAGLVHRDFKPHNILRSNDGRVLVTDFGLARGLGEITESQAEPALDASISGGFDETMDAGASGNVSASSASGVRKDSVLDSPLTQTGVLIGTPAYMAPEQFRGAPPDPRTDQFAFCVTAWQMLTGGRPYHGASLEELKKAAGEGVAHVKTNLPPLVRAALVRGMDPDPAKRWPSMDELLDELEKITKPKRPRWVIPLVIGLTLFTFVLVGNFLRRTSSGGAPRTCDAADVAFGDAWSPAVKSALWKQMEPKGVSEAAFARVTDPFDGWRTSWMQNYDEACRTTPDKLPRARLDCLFSARDDAGAISIVLGEGTPQMFDALDIHGMLPNLKTCSGPNPVSSPQIPPESRTRILAVVAKTIALRMEPDVDAAANQLVGEAKAIGWAPLVPTVMMAHGHELLRRGRNAAARDVYEKAIALSKANIRLLASLRLGVLEASIAELKKVDTPIRDGEIPAEIAVLVDAARTTARTAGNDSMMLGSVSLLEASALGARARWSYDKRLYTEAIAAAQEARRLFTEAGDLRRAAIAAAGEAEIYLQRADDHALDDAMFVTRTAEEALDHAKLPRSSRLDGLQARIAFARGDFNEARMRYARLPFQAPPSTEPIHTGVVIGADGKPVGEATVIAWVGVLDGDPQNLVTDVRTIDGAVVQTASDGTFEIPAAGGAGIIAQRGALRSTPLVVPSEPDAFGPIKIHLDGTNIVSGRVDGQNLAGVQVFTQFVLGDAIWRIRAPVHRDGTYAIGGQPRSAAFASVGAIAAVDDGERVVLGVGSPKVIEWPVGRAVEVIVRGELRDGARIWLFGGRLTTATPKTRGDAEQLARTSTAYATAVPHAIGATATPAGRDVYRSGDQHAVFVGNRPMFLTACAAADDKPASRLVCSEVNVTDGEVTDFPDGRWGTDTQAVVIEL